MVKYHLIYKITNLINGKYYIGRHSTTDINDSYMGSGIAIKKAIKKYGVENFVKEIIATANSTEELWELEKEIVNEDIVKDPNSYNNAYGGKHYLYGLKKYDFDAFIKHQQEAGKSWGRKFNKNSDWHRKGNKASNISRNGRFTYKLTTPLGEVFIKNGIELKKLCEEKNWNYNTLTWFKALGREIQRGPLKGFKVEKLQGSETCY